MRVTKKMLEESKKRRHLVDFELQILFDGFNDVFFHNRISKGIKAKFVSSKILEKLSKAGPAHAAWRPAEREIWIDKTYNRSENMCSILLLHEMAHAALEGTYVGHPTKNPGHGMIYQAEIYRLFMAGGYDGLL